MNSEEFLTRAGDMLIRDIFEPAGYGMNPATGEPLSEKLRARVGYPTAKALRRDGKAIGQCVPSIASAGGFTEIFVSPVLGKGSPMPGGDDPKTVLMTLAHEIAHAAAGYQAGHGPEFIKCIKAIGIINDNYRDDDPRLNKLGEPLAGTPVDAANAGSDITTISQKFSDYCDTILQELGDYDHYAIIMETMPSAATRLLKEVCVNNDCPGHQGKRRKNARITWYWAKQGTEFCGICMERMSVYLPRAKGAPGGKGAGDKDPNAVPVAIGSDGTMTETPLDDDSQTPFHTDPDDGPPADEIEDGEPSDDSDASDEPPEDEIEQPPASGEGKEDHTDSPPGKSNNAPPAKGEVERKGKGGKAPGKSNLDKSKTIDGPHKISLTCDCDVCTHARKVAFG